MPFEIIKPDTHIDFIGKWRICAVFSLAVILAGVVAIPLRGFRLGIDFAGGTEVQVRFMDQPGVDEGDVRAVVDAVGIKGASVIRFGEKERTEFLVKFPGEREISAAEGEVQSAEGAAADALEATASPETATGEPGQAAGSPAVEGTVTAHTDRILALEAALESEIGTLTVERVEFVGPKVGAELREDGLSAMAVACLVILGYIAFRFSARFAPGAVVALLHDVLVTSSLWILLGLEFDLRVLAALLAIIGYSLNDTIIVYDRIRENLELHTRFDLVDVLNRSVNQTLSRTLLTSATTLAAVTSLLVLGGSVVRPFALALGIGIIVGTYSSIFVAAPTLLWLESRFPTPSPSGAGTKSGHHPLESKKKKARAGGATAPSSPKRGRSAKA